MSPITLNHDPQSEDASAETPETASQRPRPERRTSS
jgi:hypothetical protein